MKKLIIMGVMLTSALWLSACLTTKRNNYTSTYIEDKEIIEGEEEEQQKQFKNEPPPEPTYIEEEEQITDSYLSIKITVNKNNKTYEATNIMYYYQVYRAGALVGGYTRYLHEPPAGYPIRCGQWWTGNIVFIYFYATGGWHRANNLTYYLNSTLDIYLNDKKIDSVHSGRRRSYYTFTMP